MVSLDISKAFDRFWQGFLPKLSMFDDSNTLIKFFFLSDESITIRVDGSLSNLHSTILLYPRVSAYMPKEKTSIFMGAFVSV